MPRCAGKDQPGALQVVGRRNLVFSRFPTKVNIDAKLKPTESSFTIDAPIRALESFIVNNKRVREASSRATRVGNTSRRTEYWFRSCRIDALVSLIVVSVYSHKAHS